MSRKLHSLSKSVVIAAGVVRHAWLRALRHVGAMRGNVARTTIARHAFYDRCGLNHPSRARDNGALVPVAINDDGLPARRAVPWLPIPSGLGDAVRAIPYEDHSHTLAGRTLFPFTRFRWIKE